MDFEQAMARLAEISGLMGKSDLKLEDSMKLYTEAVELTTMLYSMAPCCCSVLTSPAMVEAF